MKLIREVSSHSGWWLTETHNGPMQRANVNRTVSQNWDIYITTTRLIIEVRVGRLEKPEIGEDKNKMHKSAHAPKHEVLIYTHQRTTMQPSERASI